MDNLFPIDNPMGYDYASTAYFNDLPMLLQESVKQSGMQIDSEDDLKALVQNIIDNQ